MFFAIVALHVAQLMMKAITVDIQDRRSYGAKGIIVAPIIGGYSDERPEDPLLQSASWLDLTEAILVKGA